MATGIVNAVVAGKQLGRKTGRIRGRFSRLIAVILFVLWGQPSFAGVWEPIGPPGGYVFSLAQHPTNPAIVYAGTYFGGIYVSYNAGLQWHHLASPFSTKVVFTVAVNSSAPNQVFVGTFQAGIFRSDNGGQTWVEANEGLTQSNVLTLASSPVDSNHLIAGTEGGVFVTHNGGANWASTPVIEQVNKVVFDATQTDTAYAATLTNGVLKSTDGGDTWAPFNDGLVGSNITSLDADPGGSGTIYAATSSGIFVLGSGATTWQDITYDFSIGEFLVGQVLPRPQDGGIFLSTSGGVYVLPDGAAASWELWVAGNTRFLLTNAAAGLTHVVSGDDYLSVTADDGLNFFRSDAGMQNVFSGAMATLDIYGATVIYTGTDAGLEWTAEAFGTGGVLPWLQGLRSDGAIFGITPVPAVPGTVYIGTERTGVWRTGDFGYTWTQASEGLVPSDINSLDQSPVGTKIVYAATSAGLFLSRNNGANWTPYIDSGTIPVADVATDPVRENVVWFGTFNGEVYRSFDGESFFPTWRHPEAHPVRRIVPSRWANIYLVTSTGQLFASDNVGETFIRRAETDIPEFVTSVAVDKDEPWVAYVGTVFGGVYKTESNAIEWEQKNNGIDIPVIMSMATDPGAATTVYAGSRGAIYKTTDGGELWVKSVGGLPDALVFEIDVDPNDSSIVMASIQDNGIYRSTDSGLNWSPVASGIPASSIEPIVSGKDGLDTWFIGSDKKGVYRSTDGGDNWNPSSTGISLFVRSIGVDPANANRLYAGTLNSGVFRTDDAGASWDAVGLEDRNVFNVAVDPVTPSTLYVGNSLGIARSQDGGNTWDDLGNKSAWAFDVVSDPAAPDTLYITGIAGKVFRSQDGGGLWETLNSGLPQDNLQSAALDSTGQLWIGTAGSGLFSLVAGSVATNSGLPITPGTEITDIAIGGAPEAIFVGTNGAGVWRSTDAGQNWSRIDQGFTSDIVAQVAIDPFNPDRVVASLLLPGGVVGTSVFVSDDGGDNWSPGTDPGSSVSLLAFSKLTAGLLFAVSGAGALESDDGGVTWNDINGGLAGVTVTALAVDPNTPGRVYAGDGTGNIYYRAGNADWVSVGNTQTGSVRSFAFGSTSGVIHSATLGSGLLRSTDSGLTWGEGAVSGLQSVPVLFVAVDPVTPQNLYAGTGGVGLLKSTDGGLNWEHKAGVDANLLLSVVVDPEQPNTIYAGAAEKGVYVSDDGGETWVTFNIGLFNKTVTALTIDPNNHKLIYAGTEGGGVFRWRRE
jgi:photosystem II stability/assembly factor-like uncharacterized protein